ncbi:putative electron transport protein YccM [Rubripirellula amarantea]|uniref:Putative electron transport protein YccM n=1 Tax=Rubripirellula amarantea TaxID=2527999 RepID=A0A5C5WK37_9BACT|nr:4Fe-4S binding protein [Rubripirellula amarantea]TWT50465.1 putative electron transport protein YccM [Rubripirellula amarantea]
MLNSRTLRRARYRVLAFAMCLLGSVIVAAALTKHDAFHKVFGDRIEIAFSIAGVLIFSAVLIFLTTFEFGRSRALLRMEWFVPTMRKRKSNLALSWTLPGRVLRMITPRWVQSEHVTKRRGLLRKTLRRLGRSWLASPVRRVCQSVCLVTFLALFFYVCWPYSAKPAPPPLTSSNWAFETIDEDTGYFVLARSPESNNASDDIESSEESSSVTDDWVNDRKGTLYVADEAIARAASRDEDVTCIAAFEKVGGGREQVWLNLQGELTPEVMDAFFTGSGSFRLYEREPQAWPSHYANNLADKEIVHAETFLIIDPLVSISTAIASRSWVWSLAFAAVILIVCVLIPRGFCGYLCPLGTTIDLFDWAIGSRTKRFRVPGDGWWVHIKYYLLAGTLVAAVCGVLVSGLFSAIPVITRAMLFAVDPLVSGSTRGWHLVPAIGWGQVLSLVMFAAVLGLGFLRPRFWCKYVCPSGAVFSLGNLFRVTERKVESSCINCNKCVEICPFDAIKPDFTTRTSDCTMCQSCGGVCPTHAIKFVERWNVVELKIEDDPPTHETALGRRGFLSLAAGGTAASVGGITIAATAKAFGASLDDPDSVRPVRPPGSVPEKEFLEMCIRCGECFKACPNNVLQPEGFEQGLEGLWAPLVNADWAGCESSCNACGQVCPTGAIRPLPIEEKKVTRMGLAIVNEATCLPYAGTGDCDLCVQECNAAGYHAIEYTQVGTQTDENGLPIEGTGFLAPIVLEDACVGCGLCQTRCYAVNVKAEKLLEHSAIVVEAGEGKEDRQMK